MSGIGIITNPHSKLNKRNPDRAALLGYILGAQGQLEVTNSLQDLGRVAEDFKSKNIGILAINGGDGTISRTITAFIQAYGDAPLPQIALLRGGTINVLANNLGIRGSPEQVLFRLVEWHSSRLAMPHQQLNTIEIEGNYGFLFGDGVAASFLKEYYRQKSGPAGAAFLALKVLVARFFNSTLYQRVVIDRERLLVPNVGARHKHQSIAVFCSTVTNLPLGLPLFFRLKEQPHSFQCVSFTLAAADAATRLPFVLATRQEGPGKGKMSFCCQELMLSHEQAFDYTLDGELFVSKTESLKISIGPELDFITI